MTDPPKLETMIARLTRDPAYRMELTAQLSARTLDPETIDRLILYARGRDSTLAKAMVRKVLTDAGVSWEAL
ncbi:MAG TPA: hypothetical protein VFI56_27010 [Vicinamibacterales bacterium]|nr:hypothetical protein [Vicinamibacterales bacterium]